jgi:gas vesicle protein
MKDQTKIVAALLIGAAAGAAIGLLLAPDSGEGLRNSISDYVNDVVNSTKEKANSKINDIKDYGNRVVNNVKGRYNDAFGDANEYSDELLDNIKTKGERVRERANDAVEGAKTRVKSTANDWNNNIQNA